MPRCTTDRRAIGSPCLGVCTHCDPIERWARQGGQTYIGQHGKAAAMTSQAIGLSPPAASCTHPTRCSMWRRATPRAQGSALPLESVMRCELRAARMLTRLLRTGGAGKLQTQQRHAGKGQCPASLRTIKEWQSSFAERSGGQIDGCWPAYWRATYKHVDCRRPLAPRADNRCSASSGWATSPCRSVAPPVSAPAGAHVPTHACGLAAPPFRPRHTVQQRPTAPSLLRRALLSGCSTYVRICACVAR